MITAEVVLDSIGPRSPRLTTFLLRYPKFIHAEHCRHRSMSLCVSSSRAVPVSKNLAEVRDDALRAGPVYWGAEQRGMASGEELDDVDAPHGGPGAGIYVYDLVRQSVPATKRNRARWAWRQAALAAVKHAEILTALGAHKSIVNRLLEPFLHVNVLCTVCEPGLLNFFGLRLDKAAQPEMRVLAEATWAAWNESTPKLLQPGEWHLPFIDHYEDMGENNLDLNADPIGDYYYSLAVRVSVARCARLSYTSFETGRRSTIEEDLALYDRLVGAHPIHASPAEHQATPDEYGEDMAWRRREHHGNLPGWVQYRKLLPGEAVAPLPEGYAR